MSRATVLTLTLLAASTASAVDLGVIGPVHPIAEPDLLREITAAVAAKAKSGELARLQDDMRKRMAAAIQQPAPVEGLSRTTTARSFYFDPSIIIDQNITDATGHVLVAAGTRKNPLNVISLSKHLLFFDARDEAQVAKAVELIDRYQGRVKPILIAGSYLDLMRRWQIPVYYDQRGELVKKFGITQVPAIVSQEGRRLRIDELLVQD